jgi:hypothetical protein
MFVHVLAFIGSTAAEFPTDSEALDRLLIADDVLSDFADDPHVGTVRSHIHSPN